MLGQQAAFTKRNSTQLLNSSRLYFPTVKDNFEQKKLPVT